MASALQINAMFKSIVMLLLTDNTYIFYQLYNSIFFGDMVSIIRYKTGFYLENTTGNVVCL
jgi:hypothetical protein